MTMTTERRGPGDETATAEREALDEWTIGDMSVSDLDELLIRREYRSRGYEVHVSSLGTSGWRVELRGVGGEVDAYAGVTLAHALEQLLGEEA